MSSFFSRYIILLILFLLMFSDNIWSINIHGLYTSACKRELGVIVDVNDSKVQLFTLTGKIIEVPRYEIIFMTYYSIHNFPPVTLKEADRVDMVKVRTLQNNKIVDLVSGWPFDYSEDNISFLTQEGREVVIARESIWEIEIAKTPRSIKFVNEQKYNLKFIHPYPFRNCAYQQRAEDNSAEKLYNVFPQQFLSDPVIMKKELDRLMSGRKRIDKYNSWQQFYSIPQVYTNTTSLGYWFSIGSRYGASKSRNNNLAPILQNEYSSGPFGYQHLLLTGSAPIPYSVHEEPQTQVYYRLKADYIHIAAMFDASQYILPSDKYDWGKDDLSSYDDRLNQSYSGEVGIDYWHLTLQAYFSILPFGIRCGDNTYFGEANSLRIGTTFQNHLIKIEFQYELPTGNDEETETINLNTGFAGAKRDNEFRIKAHRLNLETSISAKTTLCYSVIYRTLKYNNSGDTSSPRTIYELYSDSLEDLQQMYEDNPYGIPEYYLEQLSLAEEMTSNYEEALPVFNSMIFSYKSMSITNAVYLLYSLNQKYTLGCFASIEYHSLKYRNNYISNFKKDTCHFYPKFGIHASLSF
ncbi:MAG: hypothetical protein SVZ03_08240 [Spirochaetota bacterium]|nr:hypothetical protein [Spirochaetota bacterium]